MTGSIHFEEKFNHWDRVIANFRPLVSQIVGKTTMDVYAQSQLTVPVRRKDVEEKTGVTGGALKNSGNVAFVPGAIDGEVRYSIHYAGYVHEGTYKMTARPFLKEAFDKVVPQMQAAFRILEQRLLS
jgi:HK97 gp10 family phage protein